MTTLQRILVYVVCCCSLLGCKTEGPETLSEESSAARKKLFVLLPPSETHLNFSNVLHEGLNTNILMYEYFYNGGGVATADFNNDGFIDIYFTSNMEKNKLFLNKGKMIFEDVTANSGAEGRNGPWKTGVTHADVNGDGKIDIYVCYSGTVRDENRANQLFINEGNDQNNVPHFSEQASKYGVASMGYSNQAYFFDYDHDGDLDLLLLNHNPQSLPVLNEVSTREMLKKDDPLRGVRLLKQTNGHFDDVTMKAGISGSALTYALGAGISDINGDGWQDIYISNDYAVPDYLYVNKANGTFVDVIQQSLGHTSHFSMGNDVADINNDGAPEIFTLDMLPEENARQKLLMSPDNFSKFDLNLRSGFYYQYMRNMLHLNNGNSTFSEIGQLAGISNTDWSWAALFADYDNNGFKDLFVTNGYLRDYTNLDFIKYMDDVVKSKGRLKREDVLQMVNQMPSSNVVNYIFSNLSGTQFTNETSSWGLDYNSNSNGAAYADFDNDGDLDLVINNINANAFLFENRAPQRNFLNITLKGGQLNSQGIGAKVMISSSGRRQFLEQMPARGYLSAVSPVLHFGLDSTSVIDSVFVTWPTGKEQLLTNVKSNTTLTLNEQDAQMISPKRNKAERTIFHLTKSPIDFALPKTELNDFKRQPSLVNQFSDIDPVVVKGDVNGDGIEDLYIGGGNGAAALLYIQDRNAHFVKKTVPVFEEDKAYVDADAVFTDVDNDGDNDLYVASGGYHNLEPNDPLLQDRLYINEGSGKFSRAKKALPEMFSSKGCVAANDVNQDGYVDLFVGGRVVPGRYPETPESFLLINNGDGTFKNQITTIAPDLQRKYMITDAAWHDINGDKTNELIVVGEWMPVLVYGSTNGKLADKTSEFIDKEFRGWWNTIAVEDLNGDKKPDLLIGNHGLNSQYKASFAEPIEMFYKDFDNNGSIDPILCSYIQGKSYPYMTRDEMLEQLSYLRRKFTDYKSYSTATLDQVFSKDELTSATHLVADHLTTTYLMSGEGSKLREQTLPLEAQYAPVHSIVTADFNSDGKQDILLCGNNSKMKLKIGRLDANYGSLFTGDGAGKFTYVKQSKSGLILKGDARSVVKVGSRILFSFKHGKMQAYGFSSSDRISGEHQQTALIK